MDQNIKRLPQTVDQAVDRLLSELSFKEKTKIANIPKKDLACLHFSLGMHIRNKFELWSENKELIESCQLVSGDNYLHPDDASSVIIDNLWKRLQNLNVLRVIK